MRGDDPSEPRDEGVPDRTDGPADDASPEVKQRHSAMLEHIRDELRRHDDELASRTRPKDEESP